MWSTVYSYSLSVRGFGVRTGPLHSLLVVINLLSSTSKGACGKCRLKVLVYTHPNITHWYQHIINTTLGLCLVHVYTFQCDIGAIELMLCKSRLNKIKPKYWVWHISIHLPSTPKLWITPRMSDWQVASDQMTAYSACAEVNSLDSRRWDPGLIPIVGTWDSLLSRTWLDLHSKTTEIPGSDHSRRETFDKLFNFMLSAVCWNIMVDYALKMRAAITKLSVYL